jgi:hypothetical protein
MPDQMACQVNAHTDAWTWFVVQSVTNPIAFQVNAHTNTWTRFVVADRPPDPHIMNRPRPRPRPDFSCISLSIQRRWSACSQ